MKCKYIMIAVGLCFSMGAMANEKVKHCDSIDDRGECHVAPKSPTPAPSPVTGYFTANGGNASSVANASATGVGIGIGGAGGAGGQGGAGGSVTNSGNSRNTNTVINTNTVANTNTNTNTNNVQSNNTQNATSNSASNSGGNVVESSNTVNVERGPVSTAYAAPLTASNGTCMGSTSAGGQTNLIGLSFAKTWTDENCNRRYNAQMLQSLNLRPAAVALMCQDESVAAAMKSAGIPCPNAK